MININVSALSQTMEGMVKIIKIKDDYKLGAEYQNPKKEKFAPILQIHKDMDLLRIFDFMSWKRTENYRVLLKIEENRMV